MDPVQASTYIAPNAYSNPPQSSSKKPIFITVLVLLVLAVYLVKSQWLDKPTLITVNGEGSVKVQPNVVRFNVGVTNVSTASAQAIMGNKEKVKFLITTLKGVGVNETDVTISYPRVIPLQTGNQSVYQGINSALVELKQVNRFDNLVMELYTQNFQNISNIVFTTNDPKETEKQAVTQAINDAREKAKEMAKASGKRLGRMVSISTTEVGDASATSGETDRSSGGPSQIEITRNASIVFELH